MAFRDVIARKKEPKQKVIIPSRDKMSGKKFAQQAVDSALQQLVSRLPQRTRDNYDGEVKVTEDGPNQIITVTLTDKKTKAEISGNIMIGDSDYRASTPKRTGSALADILSSEIRKNERLRPEGGYRGRESSIEVIDDLSNVDMEIKKAKKKKKKVCPICGPEDDLFPEWDGVCNHET